jgi:hypothetical protein
VRDEFIGQRKKTNLFAKSTYNTTGTGSKFLTTATDENHLRILLDKEKHETKVKKNMLFTLQDKLKEV